MIGGLHGAWKLNALSCADKTSHISGADYYAPSRAISAHVTTPMTSDRLWSLRPDIFAYSPLLFTRSPSPSLAAAKRQTFFKKANAQVETRVGPLAVAPPLSCGLKPKRKRASPIKVRLSEAEKELVRSKARQAGLSVNAFIKQVILDANYDPALRKALLAVYRELTAQGNNINQIARFVNSGQTTPVTGAEMVSNIALSVMKTHQAVRIALVQGKEMPER